MAPNPKNFSRNFYLKIAWQIIGIKTVDRSLTFVILKAKTSRVFGQRLRTFQFWEQCDVKKKLSHVRRRRFRLSNARQVSFLTLWHWFVVNREWLGQHAIMVGENRRRMNVEMRRNAIRSDSAKRTQIAIILSALTLISKLFIMRSLIMQFIGEKRLQGVGIFLHFHATVIIVRLISAVIPSKPHNWKNIPVEFETLPFQCHA